MVCFKRGERLFIPFVNGLGVPNATGRTRVYKSVESLEKSMPKDCDKYEAVEYAEVKHGEWQGKPIAGVSTVICSECKSAFRENRGKWNYCPYCGADMRGGKEE